MAAIKLPYCHPRFIPVRRAWGGAGLHCWNFNLHPQHTRTGRGCVSMKHYHCFQCYVILMMLTFGVFFFSRFWAQAVPPPFRIVSCCVRNSSSLLPRLAQRANVHLSESRQTLESDVVVYLPLTIFVPLIVRLVHVFFGSFFCCNYMIA